jgi:hypothetical protein
MANILPPVTLQGQSHLGAQYNVANPTAQVIYMPPAAEQKISYKNVFNKNLGLSLSIIQLMNAALVIITDAIAPTRFGPTFWCGILFGISGTVGGIASIRPGYTTIVTLMVFNIIAQVSCLPLFIASFEHYRRNQTIGFIQTSVCAIQLVSAIVSSSMACKATRCCCNPKSQEGVVYYTNNGGRETNNVTSMPSDFPQQQSGYMTTAIRQQSGCMTTPVHQNPIATSSQRPEVLQNESMIPRSNLVDLDSPPPKYETVANYDNRGTVEKVVLEKGCDGTK